jgi:peptide/nickel transport system permease protein
MDVLLFLARRVAIALVLLFLLTLITFVIFFRIPSEPAQFLVDTKIATRAQIQAARHTLGADRPLHVQFAKYVWRLAHGDFGRSWRTYYIYKGEVVPGVPVSYILRDAAGVTASLVFGGAALLLLLSIPLGAWSATRPRSLLDRTVGAGSLVGISTHPLVVALLLQLFVGFRWHVAPASGYCPLHGHSFVDIPGQQSCGGMVDWASHLVLPWITFALFFVALYIRIVRVTSGRRVRRARRASASSAGTRCRTRCSRS